MPPRRRNKGKQATSGPTLRPAASGDSDEEVTKEIKEPQLVLTSDKRRGIYECDYCHTDISQVPRIRCAVCPDFDLCLECFATTDHSAAIARLKAAAMAYGALQDNEKQGSISGISSVAANHVHTHGYRVADSTRYPLFPSARAISQSSKSDLGDSIDADGDDEDNKEEIEDDTVVEPEEKEETDGLAPLSEGDKMDVEDPDEPQADAEPVADETTTEESKASKVACAEKVDDSFVDCKTIILQDDSKSIWTIEEDLRLLDAISTFGLGNWADISEAIAGQGSSNKTPKRCMERYFDDYLGRYGHILPMYTIVGESEDVEEIEEEEIKSDDGEEFRASKRRKPDRATFMRSSSAVSIASVSRRSKKVKVVPTATLPGYESVWPDGYIPPIKHAELGLEVGRNIAVRAELAFVKAITNAATKAEADQIRKEWTETRLNQVDGPTALPMRPEDLTTLPGSELAGFMPRRGDFDMEWDNEAEQVIADMEFSTNDLPQDRLLKIQVIEIYNQKLDERERRKKFLLNRDLLDYRKNQLLDAQIPRDERDLVRRMRLFERLHTPEEHQAFLGDIIRAKRLRKEIAKLQMYRRMGIKTLAEVERYELDKSRREFHKTAQLQKEVDVKGAHATSTPKSLMQRDVATSMSSGNLPEDITSSLWKQYRTSDRKNRRSINRSNSETNASPDTKQPSETSLGSVDVADVEMNEAAEETVVAPKGDDLTTPDGNTAIEGNTTEIPSTNTGESSPEPAVPIISNKSPGFELLSSKETDLCQKLGLPPMHYLCVKKALILESLRRGLLDKEGIGSSKRSIVKIDVEKRGEVIDFMLRAGWISTKAGASAYQRHVVSTQNDE